MSAQQTTQSSTSQAISKGEQRQTGLARRGGFSALPSLWADPMEFFANPFSLMRRMQEEINRTFGQTSPGRGESLGTWTPPVEVAMRVLRVVSGLKAGILVALLCLTTAFAAAQSERPVSINVGGGFSPLVGNVSNDLDSGWHITGGVKYNATSTFSIGPQFLYNGFGVPGSVLHRAGAPNGDASVWAITADPRLQLPFSKLRPYLVGGVGFYRRTVNFTQPALINVTFFDPFFGYVFPGVVGTNQVLKTESRSGIGGSLGAGFGVKLGHTGTEFFTEARYHYADTGRIPTRMIPVTFGLRF